MLEEAGFSEIILWYQFNAFSFTEQEDIDFYIR